MSEPNGPYACCNQLNYRICTYARLVTGGWIGLITMKVYLQLPAVPEGRQGPVPQTLARKFNFEP
jgi:hypothetical protein